MIFSIIVPVYNRPQEVSELLESLTNQTYKKVFEVIIVEDGSSETSEDVVNSYKELLDIKYFYKENSGPGQSRNYGMQRASGNYFIILDSDVILPENYLLNVDKALQEKYTDAYGGPDAALPDFTALQKGINYAMTSFLTTGGLRGSESVKEKFQLRSFNLGLSKETFNKTGGFAPQHYGEDIELTHRIWKMNLSTRFIPKAFVYHKRRTSFQQFFQQTLNFGAARPILNKMFPNTGKLTYWFPSLFITGLFIAIAGLIYGIYTHRAVHTYLFQGYIIYFLAIFFNAMYKERSCSGSACPPAGNLPCLEMIKTGVMSVVATLVQFTGYGLGFLRSFFRLRILQKTKEETFPAMFS
ncbi:MAG: glycosyl transferase family 2 [Flavobacteriia bacterium]|nr:MAG: glycosyl transferase family 2 [Flavobacteriia bacterium]